MTGKRLHRNSTFTPDRISYDGHLVLDGLGNMTLFRQVPGLKPGQRSIAVTVTVPRALFKLPTLRAEVTIPKGEIADSVVAKAVASAKDALAGLGLNITVTSDDK